MFYLFQKKGSRRFNRFRAEFFRIQKAISSGSTPVFNEVRSAKTNGGEALFEVPVRTAFLVCSGVLLARLQVSEPVMVAVVFVVNHVYAILYDLVRVMLKNRLRLRLLRMLEVEPTERNLAVFESMEYQSV